MCALTATAASVTTLFFLILRCSLTKDGQTHTIRKSLKELEQELAEGFCRVHTSYMVNLQHLIFMGRDRESGKDIVRLDHSNDCIPIGRAYKQSANAAFLKFKEESFGV